MPDNQYKEVYYHNFCKTCKYEKYKNTEEPCNECLTEFTNLYSHMPIKYEKAEMKKEAPKDEVSQV